MKKTILILLIIISFAIPEYIFPKDITYLVKKDSNIYDSFYGNSVEYEVKKGTIIKSLKLLLFDDDRIRIKINDDGDEGYISGEDIEIINSNKFENNITFKPNNPDGNYWILSYFIDIINQKNRDLIYKYEPYWLNEYTPYPGNPNFTLNDYIMPNILFHNTAIEIKGFGITNFIIFNIKRIETNHYNVLLKKINNSCAQLNLDWSPVKDKEIFTMIMKVDGNKMKIYLEDEKHLLCELIQVDREFYDQLYDFITKDKPMTVKWKHIPADSNNDTLDTKSSGNNTTYYTPTINNLRLRSSSNLDSKVVKLMKKGEKLTFIEEGKKQTIDKINGTWIKVETEDSKIGWCFDGYLKKIE